MSAKKAKEAQLEAARLAKELAAAAGLEQQVEDDLEASASQGVLLEQEEEPAAVAVQTEVPVGSAGSELVSERLVSIRVMQMQAAVLNQRFETCVLEMHTESWIPGQVTARSQVRS